ncbi:MAG: homocysteine S-methyltransferase family protein [Actinomycetota bacterium]|nr:homocysteine S-methyltransferase family protein [Actinomycetota bacterium]
MTGTTYRHALPQLGSETFLTDGGLETDLIFNGGVELPAFAAFDLLKDAEGTAILRNYYEPYVALARESGMGFILESPTWRANPRWAEEIGYGLDQLDLMNRDAIALLETIRDEAGEGLPIVISGCVGPSDDGYAPESVLSAEEAENYHSRQIETFADTQADMITAITMTYVEEAIGITRAAKACGMPSAVSFTLETDARLPSGQGLAEAIDQLETETEDAPAYLMLNCAHPSHFDFALPGLEKAHRARIRGLRANASRMSHAELDEAAELDIGDPPDLGDRYAALRGELPNLTVLGGCCGTDLRHVTAIRDAWVQAQSA